MVPYCVNAPYELKTRIIKVINILRALKITIHQQIVCKKKLNEMEKRLQEYMSSGHNCIQIVKNAKRSKNRLSVCMRKAVKVTS